MASAMPYVSFSEIKNEAKKQQRAVHRALRQGRDVETVRELLNEQSEKYGMSRFRDPEQYLSSHGAKSHREVLWNQVENETSEEAESLKDILRGFGLCPPEEVELDRICDPAAPPTQRNWKKALYYLHGKLQQCKNHNESTKRRLESILRQVQNNRPLPYDWEARAVIPILQKLTQLVHSLDPDSDEKNQWAERCTPFVWKALELICTAGLENSIEKSIGKMLSISFDVLGKMGFSWYAGRFLCACEPYLQRDHLEGMEPTELVTVTHGLAKLNLHRAHCRAWRLGVQEEIAPVLRKKLRDVLYVPAQHKFLGHLGNDLSKIFAAEKKMERFHWPLLETCMDCTERLEELSRLSRRRLITDRIMGQQGLADAAKAVNLFVFRPTEFEAVPTTPSLSEEWLIALPNRDNIEDNLENWKNALTSAVRLFFEVVGRRNLSEEDVSNMHRMRRWLEKMGIKAMPDLDMKTVTVLLKSSLQVWRKYSLRPDERFVQSAEREQRAATGSREEWNNFHRELTKYHEYLRVAGP